MTSSAQAVGFATSGPREPGPYAVKARPRLSASNEHIRPRERWSRRGAGGDGARRGGRHAPRSAVIENRGGSPRASRLIASLRRNDARSPSGLPVSRPARRSWTQRSRASAARACSVPSRHDREHAGRRRHPVPSAHGLPNAVIMDCTRRHTSCRGGPLSGRRRQASCWRPPWTAPGRRGAATRAARATPPARRRCGASAAREQARRGRGPAARCQPPRATGHRRAGASDNRCYI
jgi:hypothetical protein